MRFGASVFLALCLLGLAVGLIGPGANAAAQQRSLADEFASASEEYGVPEELLLAMGYVNTRWEMPPPTASAYERGEIEGRGSYGIMALLQNPSRDTLGKAAELSGLSEKELKNDRAANVRGGAALLAQLQGTEKPDDLNGWYDAVAEYGGTPLYAEQVYETLESGASATISTGERLELPAQPEAEPQSLYTVQSGADYGRATFYGASDNYTPANRPGSNPINKVVIHVTQGSWSSAINWFRDPSSNVSAHYTVRSSDGFIGQSVHEEDIAWHAGNWTYNETSIGIEHEGHVSQPSWFTDVMYRSSARLTAHLCEKYRIPIDRQHIVGHNEVPGATHTDPGPHWNWTKYMRLIRGYAGDSGGETTYTMTVDNQNSERFRVSSAWDLSSWNTQRHLKNYRFTEPRGVEDPARFKLKIPSRGRYTHYGWWPASSGYNDRAIFRIQTADGVVRKAVNQRQSGGRWVSLGTYEMRAGDGWYVELSSQSSGNGYIIADAVQVRKQ